MKNFNPLIEVSDDGLKIPEVRKWSLEKYKLMGYYCDIFTSGMKYKWNQLVYIDLFAGAGYAKIKETGKIYLSSSMIALSLPNQFSNYILCERDPEIFSSLKTRVQREFPSVNVSFINDDCNLAIDQIIDTLPSYSKTNTVLPFCFVDPFSLNLNFSTIEKLGDSRLMDFLILQALFMDANRNFNKYLKEENEKISNFLGLNSWREIFSSNYEGRQSDFVRFLAEQYRNQMSTMNYINEYNMHKIRSNEKNLPLYYLAFFSKHKRGTQFFSQIEKYSTDQLKFDL